MAGGRPLVAVAEPTASGVYQSYRAQNDSSFTRYERMEDGQPFGQPFRWRASTTSGMVMTFGEATRTTGCTNINDQRAPLTGTMDSFGNEVRYEYESIVTGECRIKKISWGQNPSAGIAQAFAEVVFAWTRPASCTAPVIEPGSQRDYRSGFLVVTGASKLVSITATAYPPGAPSTPVHTRVITLGYTDGTNGTTNSESCTQGRAPLRQLASIQESAWGTDAPLVNLPAVTFNYHPATTLGGAMYTGGPPWPTITSSHPNNLAWGYRRTDDRWPTVEEMLIDIDGDGLIDRLSNAAPEPTSQTPLTACGAKWRRNRGPTGDGGFLFDAPRDIALPRLKWRGTADLASQLVAGGPSAFRGSPSREGCALNGQVTAYRNSVSSPFACHRSSVPAGQSTACSAGAEPTGQFCFPGGTKCPEFSSDANDYRTYLAYRWLDMDADGLPDLVAAVHGDIGVYDIERGNLQTPHDYTLGEPSISGLPAAGAWPGCLPQESCKDLGRCMDGARECQGDVCSTNWTIVNECLVSSSSVGCFEVLARPAGGAPVGASYARRPYERCEGRYPWFIYKNQGNGSFASAPVIKYQPIPLESDQGDSGATGPGVMSQHHAIIDFDGDGILDAVVHGKETGTASNPDAYQVWLGDGTGGFSPKRYVVPTRPRGAGTDNAISGTGGTGSAYVDSSLGLLDVNGDTLPDHWLALGPPNGNANIAFHDGVKQRLDATTITGELTTATNVKPGNDASYVITEGGGVQPILAGNSTAYNRTLDVDNDGRVDYVALGGPQALVYFNGGGSFLGTAVAYPHATGPNRDGLTRRTIATNTGSVVDPLIWELKSDLVDLDGSGVPENIYFDDAGYHRISETSASPQRLLAQIDNGRGARTAITYTQMHAPDLTVVQDPAQMWPDVPCPSVSCRPKASPHTQWVVKSLTTTDDFPTMSSETSYQYKDPRYAADDQGHYGFRGFGEVTMTAPSGAKTVQTFGYDVDWSGRLVKTVVQPLEFVGKAHSIARATWQARTLFGGTVTTYHATLSESFTCPSNKTESECTAAGGAATYSQTVPTLSALVSTTNPGVPLLWQETEALSRASTSNAEGDRSTKTTFALHADATNYRLRPLMTTRDHRVGGAMVMFGRAAKTWDAAYKVPLTNEVWVDTLAANRTIARAE